MEIECRPPSLTTGQIARIHEAALAVLHRTGVKFSDARSLELFAQHGAKVNFADQRVFFPASLVESVLAKMQSRFDLFGRGSRPPLRIGRPQVHVSNSTYDMWVLDYKSGERAKSTLAHVEEFVRLNEALDDLDIIGPLVVAQDVPLPLQQIKAAETMLKHTTKPFVVNLFDIREGEFVLEMASAVAGSRQALRAKPFLLVLLCPDSPLRYEKPVIEVMRIAAENGIPMGIGPCPILGSSSPITLAGALTQALAEALAGILLVKLMNEDCPVYLGTTPFLMAPQGNLLMGAPEGYLISFAYARICEHLGIPNSFSCTHTDSKVPTLQTGYEKMMGLMFALFSGSPILQVPAILDDGATTSFEQVVIELEMVGAAKRMLRGIEVSEETLALDIIHECAAGQSFMAHDHTAHHLRSELWMPEVFYRGTWDQLQADGKTVVEKASERVEELLSGEAPPVLSPDVQREVEEIVARACDELV